MADFKLPFKSKEYKNKSFWQKIWYFLWNDDSLFSWIANIIIAFVLIKFIVYPLLGLMMGTGLPVVAVISESMVHDDGFDEWWTSPANCGGVFCTQEEFYEDYFISKDDFKRFSLKNGFRRGDIIFLLGKDPGDLELGNVIVFNSETENSYPIIHRIIKINVDGEEYSYVTKGDHNEKPIISTGHLNEYDIAGDDLLGKALFKIPYLGYIKLIFVDLINLIK